MQGGDSLGGIEEEVTTIDEFAALKLKKLLKNASMAKKGKIPLPAADLQFCLTKTSLDKPKISQWYRYGI